VHRITPYLGPGFALVLAACLVVLGYIVLPAALEPHPDSQPERAVNIEHFMTGLACVESSGRYDAVNPMSGAYGKYQIMPRNWPVWAGRFLGDEEAEPTPENQELVARSRIERLYASRESWRRVAYWWLTGGSEKDESKWTVKATDYVDSVMRWAHMAADPGRERLVPERCFPRT
jgi:hypothetical protein